MAHLTGNAIAGLLAVAVGFLRKAVNAKTLSMESKVVVLFVVAAILFAYIIGTVVGYFINDYKNRNK